MNDIKVKNRRVNKKKALIMILLGITILGVINRTWAYVDEQIKIKAEQERLAEEKRKAEEEKKKYMVGVSHEAKSTLMMQKLFLRNLVNMTIQIMEKK